VRISLRHFALLSISLGVGLLGCNVVFLIDGTISSVQVTPANPSIRVSERLQFTAIVTFRDGGFNQILSDGAQWSTSNPAIATISKTGLATGVGVGRTAITATVGSVSGSTTLTVELLAPAVRSVEGGPGKLFFTLSESSKRLGYVANAMEDTITAYRVDAATGKSEPIGSYSVEPARGPFWMAVHPSGRFLYVVNQVSKNVSAFLVDAATGRLTAVPGSPFDAGTSPWAVSVDATGKFVYVTDRGSEEIFVYSIEQATGALSGPNGMLPRTDLLPQGGAQWQRM